MKNSILFLIILLLLPSVTPIFAEKIFEGKIVKESIPLKVPCPPDQIDPILVHEQKDKNGDKIKIYCSQGRYLMQYIKPDGSIVYVGECVFDGGMNAVYKTIRYDRITVFDNGTVKKENATFLKTWWHNFNAPIRPFRQAVNASDFEWVYTPSTNKITRFNTTHDGYWQGSTYNITRVTKIANKTFVAPDDPKWLASMTTPLHGIMSGIPTDYVYTTPVPITGYDGDKLSTVVITLPSDSDIVRITNLEAHENTRFSFDVDFPGESANLVTYSLLVAPQGMTIGENNGTISWIPKLGQVGNYGVSLKVGYGDGTSDIYNFIIPVKLTTDQNTIPITAITKGDLKSILDDDTQKIVTTEQQSAIFSLSTTLTITLTSVIIGALLGFLGSLIVELIKDYKRKNTVTELLRLDVLRIRHNIQANIDLCNRLKDTNPAERIAFIGEMINIVEFEDRLQHLGTAQHFNYWQTVVSSGGLILLPKDRLRQIQTLYDLSLMYNNRMSIFINMAKTGLIPVILTNSNLPQAETSIVEVCTGLLAMHQSFLDIIDATLVVFKVDISKNNS